MSRITKLIQARQAARQKTFVAYITAGDPNLQVSTELSLSLAKAGVDIIELGVPFSDPLADGPVNQRAAERSLAQGTNLKKIFASVATIRQTQTAVGIVIFSYLNPIYRMGYAAFAREAAAAGVDGVLIVDLPPDEASEYRSIMQAAGLDTIFLAAPTTDAKRLQHVDEQSTGFVYYVSRTGVTGMQAELSGSLGGEMHLAKSIIKKPIMVGFGISNSQQAVAAAQMGDGVVIGSALVKIIEDAGDANERIEQVYAFAADIRQSLDVAFN